MYQIITVPVTYGYQGGLPAYDVFRLNTKTGRTHKLVNGKWELVKE